VDGGRNEHVKRLHIRKRKVIVDLGQSSRRVREGDVAQDGRNFREHAAVGEQHGYARLGIDLQEFGTQLVTRAKVDEHLLVLRAGFLKRDMRHHRTGAGRVEKLEHESAPLMNRGR